MDKAKILSLFLAVLMLFCCVGTLVSCGKSDGDVKISRKTLKMDLSGFAVYCGTEFDKDEMIGDMANEVASLLSEGTGVKTGARSFGKAGEGTDEPEILIGETSRKESKKALKSIKGDGFAIRVSKNKIVIVGTTKMLTVQALQYFLDNYLTQAQSLKEIELPAKINRNNVANVVLATNSGSEITFVYSAELNDSNKYNGDPGVSNSEFDNRDFPYAVVEDLIDELASKTKVSKDKFAKQKDSAAPAQTEFMVGIVERDAVKACLAEMDGGEYWFRVKDGQIILTAWNETALNVAFEQVFGLVSAAATTKDGATVISFPEGFELRGSGNSAWRTDCPLPDGLTLKNTLDTASNSLQYLYLGEGVGPDAFHAYGNKLKGLGYNLLQENEVEESLFATYQNAADNLMIYVAYQAYAHQEEYGHAYEQSLRVVVSPTTDVAVPDKQLLSPTAASAAPVAEPAITVVEMEKGYVGMCYVITLEDGRFVIFDGGKRGDDNLMVTRLWEVLKTLYKDIYGIAPDKKNPVRVAAWVITHSHSDHYNVAREMMKLRGESGQMTVEYLIGNFPSKSATWPVYNSDIGQMAEVGLVETMQKYVKDMTYLKVQTGQKLYISNLEIEVMATYDALNPTRIRVQNDTTTVLRLSFRKSGKEDYKTLWLGDANRDESRFMCAMYGDYLKSDVVQVAHHGGPGCETDLYSSVNANVVLYPNILLRYREHMDPSARTARLCHNVDQTLIYDNENTKYVFVSDEASATLTMGADNKPMFDKVYDTMLGRDALIVYTDNPISGGTAIKVRD